jgi:YVTN family beta-propeller protein
MSAANDRRTEMRTQRATFGSLGVALAIGLAGLTAPASAATRSSSLALAGNSTRLFNVNFESDSVTVFAVENGGDTLQKLDEVTVGQEPVCVATRGLKAWVTNSASGTVSVIQRQSGSFRVVDEIIVGNEPRGCALSENGGLLLVANHTDGTVSIIDTSSDDVVDTVPLGGNPTAIAVDGDRVFVTDFFARLISGGPGEGFDEGKEGVVKTFTLSNPASVSEITLSPLADSGFTSDRSKFCNATADPDPVNQAYCPDLTGGPGDPDIVADPQAVFPNQLGAALACGGKLYLPNIGAQPSPPLFFNVNVQALVDVVDTATLAERTDLHVNLNAQIKTEPTPADPFTSLGRLFGNDLVDIAADGSCQSFLIVSRGGNYVLRARLVGGKLDIGAPNEVVRFQTGNLPSGVQVHNNGKRAYVNNEVGLSVSILDLQGNTVLARDVPSSTPPVPGSQRDSILKGKLAFFTALGIPDNGLSGLGIRDIVPLQFRGKQSSDAWSTCASCHPFGLADHVTWLFGDGPRNAIAMDGLYSKINGAHDVRISNWSAARDSVTDFNNNSRNVQCGKGFAGGDPPALVAGPNLPCPDSGATPPNPAIFDHGISQGASEALDLQTAWVQTIRPLNQPKPADSAALDAGAIVFAANCASCHGGAKWTKSQVFYLNNPALNKAFAAGGVARDPGLVVAANQIVAYADPLVDSGTLSFLDDVGTFNAANPIEIRGQGAAIGQAPLGAAGFNSPTLLGVNYSAPYFHDGEAQSLEEVFGQHLVDGQTIGDLLGDADEASLLVFLRALDGRTTIFESDGDVFKDPTRNLAP